MKTSLLLMATALLFASAGTFAGQGERDDSSRCRVKSAACYQMGMDFEQIMQSNPSAAGANAPTMIERPSNMRWYRREGNR